MNKINIKINTKKKFVNEKLNVLLIFVNIIDILMFIRLEMIRDVRMMILKQSKRRRTLFRRRKFDVLIRSI